MREFFLRRIKEMDFNPSADLPSIPGTICLAVVDPSMLKALARLLSACGLEV